MDGTPFDLLNLPDVAIRKTFSLMSPSQLLRMSRTSEQSRDLIQSVKFDVELWAHNKAINVWYARDKRILKVLPLRPNHDKMEEKEWRQVVTEISRLFGTPVTLLDWEPEDFKVDWKWIKTEYCRLKQLILTMKKGKNPKTFIRTILDNSEFTQLEYMRLTINPPSRFKFTDPFIFKKTLKGLRIVNASWFTVQNLMDSRVETCELANVKFTDEEINFILKQWMNKVDCLSNLKQLSMFRGRNTRTNFSVAFNGIQREDRRFRNDYNHFRLTCGKEFYLEVDEFGGTLDLHKKHYVDDSDNELVVVVNAADRFDDSDDPDNIEES